MSYSQRDRHPLLLASKVPYSIIIPTPSIRPLAMSSGPASGSFRHVKRHPMPLLRDPRDQSVSLFDSEGT